MSVFACYADGTALLPAGVNGLKMFGLNHDVIVYLIEQLNGANKCRKYRFKYHKPGGEPEDEVRADRRQKNLPTLDRVANVAELF